MKITWVYEPTLPFPPDHEQVEVYRRFVDKTAHQMGAKVSLLRRTLCSALPEGFLFFFSNRPIQLALEECAYDQRASFAVRLVILGTSRQKSVELAEIISPAALVDGMGLAESLAEPDDGGAFFGLSALAGEVGASCLELPSLISDHYCLLQSEYPRALPHLLASYLQAYALAFAL
jgi:hypothetical protein